MFCVWCLNDSFFYVITNTFPWRIKRQFSGLNVEEIQPGVILNVKDTKRLSLISFTHSNQTMRRQGQLIFSATFILHSAFSEDSPPPALLSSFCPFLYSPLPFPIRPVFNPNRRYWPFDPSMVKVPTPVEGSFGR